VEYADQYLIKIESSENQHHAWTGREPAAAEKIFEKTYPAIHNHFAPLRSALINRYDQGHYFWELRSCVYYNQFEKPKLVIPAITDTVNYAADETGYFSNDKTTICVPPSVPFTLAIVNSQASWWVARQTFASKQGGFFEFKPMYISQLPIPAAPPAEQSALEALVARILKARLANTAADVSAQEREIDDRVYRLYGLSKDEIKLVEEAGQP
jgi:hypothetical protein